jgi:hypothetical protein
LTGRLHVISRDVIFEEDQDWCWNNSNSEPEETETFTVEVQTTVHYPATGNSKGENAVAGSQDANRSPSTPVTPTSSTATRDSVGNSTI